MPWVGTTDDRIYFETHGAGVPVLLLYWAMTGGVDCAGPGCLLRVERGLALWLAVAFVGIPALISLAVSVATAAVLVFRSGYPPVTAAVVGASIGLVVGCFLGLVMLGLG